jgi:hypothetical protein
MMDGECKCDLHLGNAGSLTETTNVKAEDPLRQRLKDYNLNYRDVRTGKVESEPIMEALENRVEALGLDGRLGTAKNPVISIPAEPLPLRDPKTGCEYGFPNSSVAAQDSHMRKAITGLAVKHAESYVHHRFKLTLEKLKEPAFIVLNYNPDSFLNEIRQRGLSEMKKAKKAAAFKNISWLLTPLSEEEKCTADQLSLDLENLQYNAIVKSYLETETGLLPDIGKECDQYLLRQLKENLNNIKFSKQFPQGIKPGDQDHLAKRLIYKSGLEAWCKLEFDVLIIIPGSRQIFNIEVKAIDNSCDKDRVLTKIREAAKQTIERQEILRKQHSDILLHDWTYVRAVALPFIRSGKDLPISQVCSRCTEFILDRDRLENLEKWLKQRLKVQGYLAQGLQEDHQYINLLRRISGFILISEPLHFESLVNHLQIDQREENRKLNYEAVVGKNSAVVPATSENPCNEDVDVFDGRSLGNPTHLGSLRTVFLWNRDQLNVQQLDRKKVIFDCDYGTGKTLMLKSKAIHLAKSGKNEVVFVSFALHEPGLFKLLTPCKIDTIFDLQSIDDFKETNVIFLFTKKISEMYKKDHPHKGIHFDEDVCVVKLMKYLVEEKYPNAHFFLDEVLIRWINKFICCFKNRPESYTWMAISAGMDFSHHLIDGSYKQDMEKSVKEILADENEDQEFVDEDNYHFPIMRENLRNCHQIAELAQQLDLKVRRFSAGSISGNEKLLLPASTVPGSTPVIIPFDVFTDDFAALIKHAFRKHFRKESIVIIMDEKIQFLLRVNDACRLLDKEGWKAETFDIEDPNGPANWKWFLGEKQRILITDINGFKGNQADNVIILFTGFSFEQDPTTIGQRLRDMILRCTTTCVLLFGLNNGLDLVAREKIEEFFKNSRFTIDDVFSHLSSDTIMQKKAMSEGTFGPLFGPDSDSDEDLMNADITSTTGGTAPV